VANICAKNYENWLAVGKVIVKINRLTFFGPPCTITITMRVFSAPYTENRPGGITSGSKKNNIYISLAMQCHTTQNASVMEISL